MTIVRFEMEWAVVELLHERRKEGKKERRKEGKKEAMQSLEKT